MNDPQENAMEIPERKRAPFLKKTSPFQRAVLRGLGVVLPPLLTIIFLLWVWTSVQTYVLTPVKNLARAVAVRQAWDVLPTLPADANPDNFRRDLDNRTVEIHYHNNAYHRLPSDEWIPSDVYHRVRNQRTAELPMTAEAYYELDVEARWFQPALVVPFTFCVFVLLLYLLGKIIAARLGKLMWSYFEGVINHLPFVSTVYGTVKKVTDIVFADNDMEFNRVVAVEYPRRGTWSVGFVTGESLPAIATAANEPVLSVLMPTSPMPATGFTITVRKSETVDLNISVDQAFQFVVSCGVVVPGIADSDVDATTIEGQVARSLGTAAPVAGHLVDSTTDGSPS